MRRQGNTEGWQAQGRKRWNPKEREWKRKKKGQRLDELREPPAEQWASGSWEHLSEQSWQTEANSASWREAYNWYTAEPSSQASAAAEEIQHASFGELRLSNFGFASRIEAFQLDQLDPSQRTITFGIGTAACKNCCSCQSPCGARVLYSQRFFTRMCVQHCRQRQSVRPRRERILCTLDASGKPMVIESRKVNCRRPMTAVTEMTDCGRWVCFGPQRQGFSFDPRTGKRLI